MLNLVLGRAGSGKTRYALQKAKEFQDAGNDVIIVVPEQFTFEMERALLRQIGPECSLHIEVLSFSRMPQRIFSECGGPARPYIKDSGRFMIMQLALRQIADLLKIYRRQVQNPAFIRTMVDTVAQYKMGGINPEKIDLTVEMLDDAVIKQKLDDISLIMRTYDAMLQQQYMDPADDLTLLTEKLNEYPFFNGKVVIIDSFKDFTAQENLLLGRIMRQAQEVFITLCTDILADSENGVGLFSTVQATARQLIRLAKQANIPVSRPQFIDGVQRFKNDSLIRLEEKIFRPGSSRYEKQSPEIQIVSASNIYDEVQYAAHEISRLVREKNCHYRDFVIISRGLELYQGILDPIFKKYGIPLFFDTRREIETHPLMALVFSALDILVSNFRQEHIFRYLKTELAGIDVVETSLLENYVLTWGIKGMDNWQREWVSNPDGFTDKLNRETAERLSRINHIRQKFMAPLLKLSETLEAEPGAAGKVRAIYDFLCDLQVRRKISGQYEKLMDDGEVELADEYRQIWDKLIEILEQAAATLQNADFSLKELTQLLRLAVANAEMAHIPPSLDEVTAGDADRIRAGDAKYAFVVGLAEGVFPRTQNSGGLITENENEKLIKLGLELAPPAQKRLMEERFIAYKALTCASEGLYLTYPRCDASGKTFRPSHFLLEVKNLFPGCRVMNDARLDPLDSIQNERTAFELLAVRYRQNDRIAQTISRYFSDKPEYASRLNALSAAAKKEPARIKDKSAAKALFGERLHITPSRMETFEQCGFLYFCKYGLGAKPRKKAEFHAPEIGTLIHFVLERLLSRTNGRKLWEIDEIELDKRISELLDEFAEGFLGGLKDKPERFKYLFYRLRDSVFILISHLSRELSQSDFYPVDFELDIRRGGHVEPLVIDLPAGGSIAVEGKVDRVDLMKKNGRTFLRVIDYKTGSKTFHLPDVIYGLNLQMFIYLFTLCENGAARYQSDELLPAGVLYLPARKPDLSAERTDSDEKIRTEFDRNLKMSGLVNADPNVLTGMEKEGRGIFIPAKFNKNNEVDLNTSVATLEQFGVLRRHIGNLLKSMADALHGGEIAAIPVSGLGYKPCDYCEFTCVCGHEDAGQIKFMHTHSLSEVWSTLKGDEDGGRKELD